MRFRPRVAIPSRSPRWGCHSTRRRPHARETGSLLWKRGVGETHANDAESRAALPTRRSIPLNASQKLNRRQISPLEAWTRRQGCRPHRKSAACGHSQQVHRWQSYSVRFAACRTPAISGSHGLGNCGQAGPYSVTLRMPRHGGGGCGAFQQRSPIGGAAKGIPRNAPPRGSAWRLRPSSAPLEMTTCGAGTCAPAARRMQRPMSSARHTFRRIVSMGPCCRQAYEVLQADRAEFCTLANGSFQCYSSHFLVEITDHEVLA